MIDEKYIELIHKEIDGIIRPDELRMLKTYLNENPEAQTLYRELQQTVQLLNQVEEIEPSVNLKEKIMSSIDPNKSEIPRRKTASVSFMSRWFVKPVYTFALGMIAGLLIYGLVVENMIQKNSPDTNGLYGTIGMKESMSGKKAQKVSVLLPEIKGTISMRQAESVVKLEANLTTPYECDLILEYDPSLIRFDGMPMQGRYAILENSDQFVRIKSSGQIQYNIYFTRLTQNPVPVNVKLIVSGTERYNHKFMIDSQYQ